MRKIKKMFSRIRRFYLRRILFFLSLDKYITKYQKWLIKNGMDIKGTMKFINPDVYFDGTDYGKIHIGNNVTISREVMILTHDYSLTNASTSLTGKVIARHEGEMYFLNDVFIGNNVFIGARASILPGSIIGDNCIIGACCVVKGTIPDDSICIGNPAVVIGKTSEYAKKHLDKKDYLVGSL